MHNRMLLESYSIWCESSWVHLDFGLFICTWKSNSDFESYWSTHSNCRRKAKIWHACPIITDQNLTIQVILHNIDDLDPFLFL
jgi:hypothetical protein